MVNEERRRHRLPILERDSALDRIGLAHSIDMGKRGYFAHIDLTGRNATQRGHRADYVCVVGAPDPKPASLGENLFAGFRYSEYSLTYYPGEIVADFAWKTEEEFAREVVTGWLESPPHRANLLHPAYQLHGLGIYLSLSLEFFVTQNLC
jgi:uncharacterized protein YkwD